MTNVEEQAIRNLITENTVVIRRALAQINIHREELEAMLAAYRTSILKQHGIIL